MATIDIKKVSFAAGGQSLSDPAKSEWLQQLTDALCSSGEIQIVPPSDPSAQLFVSLDLDPRRLLESLRWQKCSRALFLAEPRTIRPIQFLSIVQGRFDRVFSPSPLYKSGLQSSENSYTWSTWVPQAMSTPISLGMRSAGVGMIAGDKFSFVAGQQYELRRKVIESWPSTGDFPLAVAGTGWFRTPAEVFRIMAFEALRGVGAGHLPFGFFQSLRRRLAISGSDVLLGTFDGHQADFLRQYEFALVIENDPTIVTEKFWQAIEAGCIPLYFGPDLELFGLPASSAIQMKNLEEIRQFDPSSLSEDRKESILACGANLLQTSTERTFHYSIQDISAKVSWLLRTQSR